VCSRSSEHRQGDLGTFRARLETPRRTGQLKPLVLQHKRSGSESGLPVRKCNSGKGSSARTDHSASGALLLRFTISEEVPTRTPPKPRLR
jgi:hypothetical protein